MTNENSHSGVTARRKPQLPALSCNFLQPLADLSETLFVFLEIFNTTVWKNWTTPTSQRLKQLQLSGMFFWGGRRGEYSTAEDKSLKYDMANTSHSSFVYAGNLQDNRTHDRVSLTAKHATETEIKRPWKNMSVNICENENETWQANPAVCHSICGSETVITQEMLMRNFLTKISASQIGVRVLCVYLFACGTGGSPLDLFQCG